MIRPVTMQWENGWRFFAGPCHLHSVSAVWLGTVSIPELAEAFVLALQDSDSEPTGVNERTVLLGPQHDFGAEPNLRQFSLSVGRDFLGPLEFKAGLWIRAMPAGTGETTTTAMILPC